MSKTCMLRLRFQACAPAAHTATDEASKQAGKLADEHAEYSQLTSKSAR